GGSFVRRFDANTYLALLDAMDHFDAMRDRRLYQGLRRLGGPLLIAAFTSDVLFPASQSHELAQLANEAGTSHRLEIIHTEEGHDAFLMPSEPLERAVVSLLAAVGEA
ncbi:MAG: homoserine O-acetyltransferase, partial [Planctomycetota bacterium]